MEPTAALHRVSDKDVQIFTAASSLPEPDCAKLAIQLLDSLDATEPDTAEAWRSDVERRAREVRDGKIELLDHDEAMAELRALDNQ